MTVGELLEKLQKYDKSTIVSMEYGHVVWAWFPIKRRWKMLERALKLS